MKIERWESSSRSCPECKVDEFYIPSLHLVIDQKNAYKLFEEDDSWRKHTKVSEFNVPDEQIRHAISIILLYVDAKEAFEKFKVDFINICKQMESQQSGERDNL